MKTVEYFSSSISENDEDLLSYIEKKLLRILKKHAEVTGYSFCNIEEFVNELHCSRRTVFNLLRKLEIERYIIREKFGKRVLIWTEDTFKDRESYLKEFNPKYIGRRKFAAKIKMARSYKRAIIKPQEQTGFSTLNRTI